jgi:deoxyhypusine synthase
MSSRHFLSGRTIEPGRLTAETTVTELIAGAFGSYNAGRLREGCRLFTEKMLEPDVMVGLTMTGALTPTGLGSSTLIPLIEAGFIDWITTTGGNLYHDAHFALNLPLHRGNPFESDPELRAAHVVRIYDIFFDHQVLLDTDAFFRQLIGGAEFRGEMSTAEFHYLAGGYLAERERALGQPRRSLLAACHDYGVPVYTPSPGDSSIGMIIAAAALAGDGKLLLDPIADVNEAGALFLAAKSRGRSAVFVLGGGSPKNFILQVEPYLQEMLGLEVRGHDYFLQITDTRPDTGSLSGAAPAERPLDRHHDTAERTAHAAARGRAHGSRTTTHAHADGASGRPDQLPDAVTCYTDATIALPLLAAYALANREPREPKRLYGRLREYMARLRAEQARAAGDEAARERARQGAGERVTLERDR